jgi:hypothetical protein
MVNSSWLKFGILLGCTVGCTVVMTVLTIKTGIEAVDPIYAKIVKEHAVVLQHIKSSPSLLNNIRNLPLDLSSVYKIVTLHAEYKLGYDDAKLLVQYAQLTKYDIPGVLHLDSKFLLNEEVFTPDLLSFLDKNGIEVNDQVVRDLLPSPPTTTQVSQVPPSAPNIP